MAANQHTEHSLLPFASPPAIENVELISHELTKLTRARAADGAWSVLGPARLETADRPDRSASSDCVDYNEVTRDTRIESVGIVMDALAEK